MAVRIALLNQKGGVGKTSIAVNLAYGLALDGQETLLLDLDPQAHTSMIYCDDDPTLTINEIFERRDAELRPLVRQAMVAGKPVDALRIVPSNLRLAVIAERMLTEHFRERRLHTRLEAVENAYEFILLDCPPNLGVLTVNAIYSADVIIIPITYGRYALDGTADLLASIGLIRDGSPARWAILRNAFDARNRATVAYVDNELANVEANLMRTVIRRTEAINQAQIRRQPVFTYDPKSRAARDFTDLTKEIHEYVNVQEAGGSGGVETLQGDTTRRRGADQGRDCAGLHEQDVSVAGQRPGSVARPG